MIKQTPIIFEHIFLWLPLWISRFCLIRICMRIPYERLLSDSSKKTPGSRSSSIKTSFNQITKQPESTSDLVELIALNIHSRPIWHALKRHTASANRLWCWNDPALFCWNATWISIDYSFLISIEFEIYKIASVSMCRVKFINEKKKQHLNAIIIIIRCGTWLPNVFQGEKIDKPRPIRGPTLLKTKLLVLNENVQFSIKSQLNKTNKIQLHSGTIPGRYAARDTCAPSACRGFEDEPRANSHGQNRTKIILETNLFIFHFVVAHFCGETTCHIPAALDGEDRVG